MPSQRTEGRRTENSGDMGRKAEKGKGKNKNKSNDNDNDNDEYENVDVRQIRQRATHNNIHTGHESEETGSENAEGTTELPWQQRRRGYVPKMKLEYRTWETKYKSDPKSSKMRDAPSYMSKEVLNNMSHSQIQRFVRLHNNRIDTYVTNEYFNWISHLVGAILFIIAMGILGAECQYYNRTKLQLASVIVYCMCIIFMQTASTLHHGVGLGGVSWRVYFTLRMMDYMSIYIAIWGSFLPVLSLVVDFPTNLVMFIVTTLLAVAGITLKAIYNEGLNPFIGIGLYVVMGWDALTFTYFIFKNAGFKCFLLLILMGLSYSVGIIFFATEKPIIVKKVIQGHELFHLFVLAGNLIHLFNVAFCMIPSNKNNNMGLSVF